MAEDDVRASIGFCSLRHLTLVLVLAPASQRTLRLELSVQTAMMR